MRVLLDTATFLWIASGSSFLSQNAIDSFSDPNNEVFLSVVSVWEICVKHGLGKLPLPEAPQVFVTSQRTAHGIKSLILDEGTALDISKLPSIHRDPFDRMLICQARTQNLVLLTPDAIVRSYPVKTLW